MVEEEEEEEQPCCVRLFKSNREALVVPFGLPLIAAFVFASSKLLQVSVDSCAILVVTTVWLLTVPLVGTSTTVSMVGMFCNGKGGGTGVAAVSVETEVIVN